MARSEFSTPLVVFPTRALLKNGRHIKWSFRSQVIARINPENSSCNDLFEKLITAINPLNDSSLDVDLSKNHKVDQDCLASAFIPDEALESSQKHTAVTRYSDTSLF